MRRVLAILAGMVASLLPAQFRNRWQWGSDANLRTSTILSGAAEVAISLGAYVLGFLSFMQWRVGGLLGEGAKGAGQAQMGEAIAFGAGATAMVEYIFSPLSMLLVYFAVEGAVRLFAALVTDECVGTLPLAVVGWIFERGGRAKRDRQLGPRVVDEVQPCHGISYDLVIASCRAKPGWDRLVTIEYQDKLYELFDQKKGFPPRPYIYQLREHPNGKVVRGLHHYSPDEALTEKERLALKPAEVGAKQGQASSETQRDKK
jgi:hypothetical protein